MYSIFILQPPALVAIFIHSFFSLKTHEHCTLMPYAVLISQKQLQLISEFPNSNFLSFFLSWRIQTISHFCRYFSLFLFSLNATRNAMLHVTTVVEVISHS